VLAEQRQALGPRVGVEDIVPDDPEESREAVAETDIVVYKEDLQPLVGLRSLLPLASAYYRGVTVMPALRFLGCTLG
jgi:hypothetical protein